MKKISVNLPDIPGLHNINSSDVQKVSEMLGRAFSDDPIWSVILEGQEEKFPDVFEVPINYSLRYGRVYADSKDIKGAGVWLASPYTDMNLWRLFRSGALKAGMKLGYKITRQISQVFSIIEKDRKNLMKNKSYVYLYVLGVDPSHQGQGIGSMLTQKMLDYLPNDVPIYLETETEQNVTFYEKLGFEIVKQVKLPILDLPMWEMVNWKRRA